jgi:hypothetical protein
MATSTLRPMIGAISSLVLVLALSMVASHCAWADYSVRSEVRGYFCPSNLVAISCWFERVDAVASAGATVSVIADRFTEVSEFKPDPKGDGGRCFISLKGDPSRWGWLASGYNQTAGVPQFYKKRQGASEQYENLGTPEYIVFRCQRTASISGLSEGCFPAAKGGIHLFRAATVAENVMMVCGENWFSSNEHFAPVAIKSKFLADSNEEDRSCESEWSRLTQPIMELVTEAFEEDGEEKFCQWARTVVENKDNRLFKRFLR